MKYEFSLTSKTIIALAAGFTAAALLLFLAGIFVGIGLGEPAGEVQMARRLGVPPDRPRAPKLSSPAVVATAASPPAAPAPEPALVRPESKPTEPAPPAESDSSPTKGFALQVGAFRDAKHAKTLLDELKERGYSVTLFNSTDSRWHAVRIVPNDKPAFADLPAASRAAVDFRNKEQIQAFVRPVDSL